MSWAAVAVGAVSLGVGIYQTVDGNNKRKKAEKNRPEYESPREIAQNTNLAEQMAYEGLPMEQKRAFQREVQRSQAAALSSQGQLNAQLSGLAATNVASMDALSNMHVQDARARNENRRALMNQRNVAAGYRDREFAYDHQFYQQELDTANAMIGAGMQNMAGGAGMAASGASNAGWGQRKKDGENKIQPGASSKGPRVSLEEQNAAMGDFGTGFEYSSYYFEPNIY